MLIAPRASSLEAAAAAGITGGAAAAARDGRGLLLRYDVPPSPAVRAEAMLLVKARPGGPA